MKTVMILGEEVEIRFNLGVQIAYEEMTGEVLDLTAITTGKKAVALYYSILMRNGWKGGMEDLLTKVTAAELNALGEATAEAVREWAAIPGVMKEEETDEDDGKKK